jgi:LCP family protein required for cell wall assembly
MKNRIGLLLIGSGVVFLVVLGFVFVIPSFQKFWEQPLGPELGFEGTLAEAAAYTPTVEAEDILAPVITQSGESFKATSTLEIPTMTAVAIPTHTPEVYCGDIEEMIILVAGIDSRSDTYGYGRADVIRLVRVDFTMPRVTVLSFPRDLWVEIPGIEDHEITQAKLNQAYFYGATSMKYYDGPGGGAGLLARTLEKNFGVRPDNYGVVNLKTLEEIIDALGGIDIYLESEVDARHSPETEDQWKYYPAGWNHLDGKRAVYYARIRKSGGVFTRVDRQTEVLCAVQDQLLGPSAVLSIPDIVSAFIGHVETDLSPAQLSQMACLAPKLSWDDIIFAKIPTDLLTAGKVFDPNMEMDTFVWQADYNVVRYYVDMFEVGMWPTPGADGTGGSGTKTTDDGQLCPQYPEKP